MSQLTDKKPRNHPKRDVQEPAVRYVRKQREKNNEDAKDAKLLKADEPEEAMTNFSEYYNMSTMTKQVASNTWAEKMARHMIDWAENNEDALTLEAFYRSIGMLSQDFCDIARKYPTLEKALQYTRMVIGDRREHGMITRKFDAGSIAYMMPHYKDTWKEMVAWRSSLKQSEGSSGAIRMQYVVVPEIPSSDLVKPLPKMETRLEEIEDGEANSKNDLRESVKKS